MYCSVVLTVLFFLSLFINSVIATDNNVVTIDKKEDVSEFVEEMKSYTYLLNYHNNKKVDLVYKFYKLLGYKGMLKVLKMFLKIRG